MVPFGGFRVTLPRDRQMSRTRIHRPVPPQHSSSPFPLLSALPRSSLPCSQSGVVLKKNVFISWEGESAAGFWRLKTKMEDPWSLRSGIRFSILVGMNEGRWTLSRDV